MKLLIIILLLLATATPTSAANVTTIEQLPENKKFSISGKCLGNKVIIQLSRNNDTIDYSAERPCVNSAYELNDNFEDWKLPTGNYHIFARDDETLFATSTEDKQIVISEASNAPIEIIETAATAEEPAAEDNLTVALPDTNKGFFGKILIWLVEWFKTALLQINELITHKTTTDQLCLGGTCIEEQALKNLLSNTPTTEKLPDPKPTETIKTPELPPETLQ